MSQKRNSGEGLKVRKRSKSAYALDTSLLPSSDFQLGPGFHISAKEELGFVLEDGSKSNPKIDRQALLSNILLENPEAETRWYFKYFLGNQHHNYLLRDNKKNSMVLSIMVDQSLNVPVSATQERYRVILWRKEGSERRMMKFPKGKVLDPRRVSFEFGFENSFLEKKIVDVRDPKVQNELLQLEEQEGAVNFKFGILVCKKGQRTDDEMFSNETGSEAFQQFCEVMGEKIVLKGFNQFRGGLDIKNDTTGTHSYYTVLQGKEVMFHVSTMLPYSKDNPQQVERKRHLGNDICNIVFQEDHQTPFFPEMIKSNFNHVFAVVSRLSDGKFQLKIYAKESVPCFGPALPNPSVFEDPHELRQFLIVKLMNGEKAALSSTTSAFAKKKMRTLECLLNLMHDHFDPSKSGKNGPMVSTKPVRSDEHFRVAGQQLKVDKIVSGVAPTSSLTTSSISSSTTVIEPWLTTQITNEFPYEIICADSYLDYLYVGTAEGIFCLRVAEHDSGSLEVRKVTDRSFNAAQILIDDRDHVAYIRTHQKRITEYLDPSVIEKDPVDCGSIYAVPMVILEDAVDTLNKAQLKKYAIKNTKKSYHFDVTMHRRIKGVVKLAVASANKINMFDYVAINPGHVPGMGTGGSYNLLSEHTITNGPVVFISISKNVAELGTIVYGTKAEIRFLDIKLGIHTVLQTSPGPKFDAISCVDVTEDGDKWAQFALTYNQVTVFKDERGLQSKPFEIKFLTKPHAVGYVYPYLLGFSMHDIEIFTLLNGNVVKTIAIPNIQLLSVKTDLFFVCHPMDNDKVRQALLKMSGSLLSGKNASVSLMPEAALAATTPFKIRKMSSTPIERASLLVTPRRADDAKISSPLREASESSSNAPTNLAAALQAIDEDGISSDEAPE